MMRVRGQELHPGIQVLCIKLRIKLFFPINLPGRIGICKAHYFLGISYYNKEQEKQNKI
jgi:hypothetical protein